MHIFFIGQQGILAQNSQDKAERRVEALAELLSQQNFRVTVACTQTYTPKTINRIGAIELYKLGNLLPKAAQIAMYLWRKKPDVVHVHNWKYAVYVRFFALLSPNTTYIWTVTHINESIFDKLVALQARQAFDAISTPERTLQYKLLNILGIRATYIPDGYSSLKTPEIPASSHGLRKGTYVITTASQLADIELIARTYKQTGSRKKLVTFVSSKADARHLKRRFSFIHPVIATLHSRAAISLVRQSALLIAPTADELVLQAMDAERPIIAFTEPSLEEIVGTTAVISSSDNPVELEDILSKAAKHPKTYENMAKKADKRAKSHFRWERVLQEYASLYRHSAVRKVPIDSLIPRQRATLGA